MLQKEYLDEKEASLYMMQILQAIDYFHQQKIVHLDLKVPQFTKNWFARACVNFVFSFLESMNTVESFLH